MQTKPKLGCWICASAPILFIAMFAFVLVGPNPKVVVSPQTTRITKPLGPNGLPEYDRYWHDRAQAGVTPDNNAAVLIWKATWPGELRPEQFAEMCDALGMEIPTGANSLVSVFDQSVLDQIKPLLPKAEGEVEITPDEVVQDALETPWTTEQLPVLASWGQQNQGPLDLLVEGANRPKYFSPSPTFLGGQSESLIAMLLPGIQGLRDAARCLLARAMWNLGEQRPMDAWRDLQAVHLLARHAGRGETLIHQLVGIAIEGMACHGTQTLLHHGDLTQEQATEIRSQLEALPQPRSMAEAIDGGERLMFLDSSVRFATGQWNGSDLQGFGVGDSPGANLLLSTRVDWNVVLRTGNEWYDRLVEAGQLPRAERVVEMAKINAELEQLRTADRPARLVGGVFSGKARSELVADTMLQLFLPSMEAAMKASDRVTAQISLTRLAAALAVYRATAGEYPDYLEALIPDYLRSLPADTYSGKSFLYERREDGYLLYSVFENGVNDGGTDFGGKIILGEWTDSERRGPDYANTDLVIRVPRPPLAMPQLRE